MAKVDLEYDALEAEMLGKKEKREPVTISVMTVLFSCTDNRGYFLYLLTFLLLAKSQAKRSTLIQTKQSRYMNSCQRRCAEDDFQRVEADEMACRFKTHSDMIWTGDDSCLTGELLAWVRGFHQDLRFEE